MLEVVHDEKSPILQLPGSMTYGCVMVGMALLAVLALQSAWRAGSPVRAGARAEPQVPGALGNDEQPTMSALILVVFLGAAVIAMPIAHALLMAAMAAAATSDRVPLDLLVQQMVAQVQSFPLIAIPFFMLTGTLMMGGKLGEALVGVLSALIGRFHGGPAQVGVLSSTLFGGVSGSAVADASAIGSLLIPWHKRLGYPAASRRRHWRPRRRSTS